MRIPLMGVWDRAEYLSARHAQRVYEACKREGKSINITEPDHEIKCSFCTKKIIENDIHLVEYGEKVACQKCFRARYKNRRQLFKELIVPSDLDTVLDAVETPAGSDVDKAVDIQDKNVARLRAVKNPPEN